MHAVIHRHQLTNSVTHASTNTNNYDVFDMHAVIHQNQRHDTHKHAHTQMHSPLPGTATHSLDNLAYARRQLPVRERGQRVRVAQHAAWLVERANHVLAKRVVHARLATHAAVHLRHHCCGDLQGAAHHMHYTCLNAAAWPACCIVLPPTLRCATRANTKVHKAHLRAWSDAQRGKAIRRSTAQNNPGSPGVLWI